MRSHPDRLVRAVSGVAPKSVVARTTGAIIALSVLMGIGFTLAASWLIHRNEYLRLDRQLDQLVSTVENTTRIACFLSDRSLAREVATGLLQSDAVGGVRIRAGTTTLYAASRSGGLPDQDSSRVIRREIRSPFEARQVLGEIILYPSDAQLHSQAWAYTRFTLFILAAELVVVAAGVAVVVFLVVTRPIKGVSDELHRLRMQTGAPLRVPAGNEGDEIGRLVADVNALIASLNNVLRAERTLRLQHAVNERKMRLAFEKAETGIFAIDAEGVLQSWNPAFVRLLGLKADPVEGTGLKLQHLLPEHANALDTMIQSSLREEAPREEDLEIQRPSTGAVAWIETSINPVGPHLLQGVINDVTERRRSVAAAQQLAMRDVVTGLLNRRGLDANLTHLFGSSGAHRPPVAMLHIDLDLFKQVNDTHGHDAGDQVLRQVAQVIERAVRRVDPVARTGGDEFVVALVGIGTPAKAMEIADNIIAGISAPIDLGNGSVARVGASIGIAFPCGPEETASALIRRADAAMYAAKQSGRGRIRIASAVGAVAESAS